MLKRGLFRKPDIALEDYGRPTVTVNPSVPDKLYVHCDACRATILSDDLAANAHVCTNCGYHFQLSARQRLMMLADHGSFSEMDAAMGSGDPIGFPGYGDKLQAARADSGEMEAVVTGTVRLNGMPCCVFAMEPYFMMGSMGSVVGEKIARIFEKATMERLPVIGFCVSGGARMQEGILSLMQMAKTSGAVKWHSDGGLLYIAVLTHPTTGGVTASFAMEADVILAEPEALVAFAGPRVIEQTIKQKLPAGFQRAEFLRDNGFVDAVVPRTEQRQCLAMLLSLHRKEETP